MPNQRASRREFLTLNDEHTMMTIMSYSQNAMMLPVIIYDHGASEKVQQVRRSVVNRNAPPKKDDFTPKYNHKMIDTHRMAKRQDYFNAFLFEKSLHR